MEIKRYLIRRGSLNSPTEDARGSLNSILRRTSFSRRAKSSMSSLAFSDTLDDSASKKVKPDEAEPTRQTLVPPHSAHDPR